MKTRLDNGLILINQSHIPGAVVSACAMCAKKAQITIIIIITHYFSFSVYFDGDLFFIIITIIIIVNKTWCQGGIPLD